MEPLDVEFGPAGCRRARYHHPETDYNAYLPKSRKLLSYTMSEL